MCGDEATRRGDGDSTRLLIRGNEVEAAARDRERRRRVRVRARRVDVEAAARDGVRRRRGARRGDGLRDGLGRGGDLRLEVGKRVRGHLRAVDDALRTRVAELGRRDEHGWRREAVLIRDHRGRRGLGVCEEARRLGKRPRAVGRYSFVFSGEDCTHRADRLHCALRRDGEHTGSRNRAHSAAVGLGGVCVEAPKTLAARDARARSDDDRVHG